MKNFCPKCGTKLIVANDYTMIGDQTATTHRVPYCPKDGLLTSGSKVSRTSAIIAMLLHLCANSPVPDVPKEDLIETVKKLKSQHRNIPDNIILIAVSKKWNLDLKIPVLCIYCWSSTIVFCWNRDYICTNCGKHFKEEEFQTLIEELLLSV